MKGLSVKEILQKNGFTMTEVAARLGESRQNFNALLSKDDVKTGLLERIAEATGLQISTFYGGDVAPASEQPAPRRVEAQHLDGDARLLDEIAAQRRITEKAMQQNSDLLEIVKKLSDAVAQK